MLTGPLTDRTRTLSSDGVRYDRAMPERHFPPPPIIVRHAHKVGSQVDVLCAAIEVQAYPNCAHASWLRLGGAW